VFGKTRCLRSSLLSGLGAVNSEEPDFDQTVSLLQLLACRRLRRGPRVPSIDRRQSLGPALRCSLRKTLTQLRCGYGFAKYRNTRNTD
jgi:hypothetical protein